MKAVTIGGVKMNIKATPLSLLYYNQEFGGDLIEDMTKLGESQRARRVNAILFLQIMWALAKTAAEYGAPFAAFEDWLKSLDSLDFGHADFIDAMKKLNDETESGFFRTADAGPAGGGG